MVKIKKISESFVEREDIKDSIRNNVKIETVPPKRDKGMNINVHRESQRLYSEELNLTIELGHRGSSINNRKILMELFEEALNKIIK
jgi:hypothetical protein